MIRNIIYIVTTLCILLLSACFDDIKNPVGPNKNFSTVIINLSTSDDGSVKDANIKLQHNTISSLSYTATAEDDVVTIERVEYGVYTLLITHNQYGEFSVLNLDIQSPTVTRSVTLSPQEYTDVTIKLKTANNSKAIGVITRLVNNNGNSSQTYNHTVSDSAAFFDHVATGEYTFTVTLNTFTVYKDSVFVINAENMFMTVELDILAQVTLLLNPNFGSLLDANVRLTNANLDRDQIFETISTDNVIIFQDVLWGRYTLEVEHNDFHNLIINNFSVLSHAVSDTVNMAKMGPAGGFVIYDKGIMSDEWQYLEVAPVEHEFIAQWSTNTKNVSGTQEGIGMGLMNTELIIAVNEQMNEKDMAAQTAITIDIAGYTGWYLPSKNELNLMYETLHKKGFGGFQKSGYWSSTQYGNFFAWGIMFSSGVHTTIAKNNENIRVRVVRAY